MQCLSARLHRWPAAADGNGSWFLSFTLKFGVTMGRVPDCLKWRPFIQSATPFYCLFWFESLVWWVNEGLWVQLTVVMRPLPHSFTLGHNKSATPAFGFLASPATGSWRKLGALLPLHSRACHFGIREHEPPSEGEAKELNSWPLPGQPPTFCYHPARPSAPLGRGLAALPWWDGAWVTGTRRA